MIDPAEYIENIGLITKEGDMAVPLIGVLAEATIVGKSSKVKITQKYKNEGKCAIEAVYRFPLPENASVTGFCILLEDKTIRGEIEERKKAFDIYDDALIKGNGAVLLDQERPNIFTLSVGNLNPGKKADIEIEYISVLDYKNNNLRFFLPTTISPRYIPENMADEDGIPAISKVHPPYAGNIEYGLSLKVDILKAAGPKACSISSPSHKIKSSFDQNNYTVEFTSESVSMDRDFVLDIGYEKDCFDRGIYYNSGQESFMQIDFNPVLEKQYLDNNTEDNNTAGDIIFVLDCSGSMQGTSIAQAKKSLEIQIRALNPKQLFNIYRFGSSFDKFSLNSKQFDELSLTSALDFLAGTDADFGGTEILEPLKDIYSNALNSPEVGQEGLNSIKSIVLITDGEVGNESEVIRLVNSNRNMFRVFTVGIGFGPNEYFIKEMARATGGDYLMVHPEERIDIKVISMFGRINMGAVENIKIDYGFSGDSFEPVPVISSIFSGNSYQVFVRIKSMEISSLQDGTQQFYAPEDALSNISGNSSYKVAGIVPEKVLITGVFKGKYVRWELPVTIAGSQDNLCAFIPKLWAREKIREIEEGLTKTLGSQQAERKVGQADDLIINISKRYGVISSKTSFVSVEERSDEEKTKGEAVLKKIPTLITYGWHGFGAKGALPDNPFMITNAMSPIPGVNRGVSKNINFNNFYEGNFTLNERFYKKNKNDAVKNFKKPAFLGKNVTSNNQINNSISSGNSKSLTKRISAEAPFGPKTKLKEEILLEILTSQKPAGGFELGDRLAEMLKIDIAELKTVSMEMRISNGSEKDSGRQANLITDERFEIIINALIVGILDEFFKDMSDSWDIIIKKSRNLLQEKLKDFNPEIKSQKLMDFISAYILKINIFKSMF